MSQVSVRIADHFADLTDPRRREVVHPLINIVTIALCAVICGADDFVSIASYGREKQKWLAKFLDLGAGIPSHDRFNAVFAALRPGELLLAQSNRPHTSVELFLELSGFRRARAP